MSEDRLLVFIWVVVGCVALASSCGCDELPGYSSIWPTLNSITTLDTQQTAGSPSI